MVSWAMVLETAIKWLIPAICVAIVGLITAHFVKPLKKPAYKESVAIGPIIPPRNYM